MARDKNISERLMIGAATVGILLVASGCGTDVQSGKDFFPPDSQSPVHKTFDAQAAAGAQQDATLYPEHFDGDALNSLGQAKLDLITAKLPDQGPLTIYIVPSRATSQPAGLASARTDAVTQYLLSSHLSQDQFKLVDGPNLDRHSMVGNGLANYGKTDTGAASDSSTGDASAGEAGSASSAVH